MNYVTNQERIKVMELLHVVLKMIFKKSLRFYKFMQKKIDIVDAKFHWFLRIVDLYFWIRYFLIANLTLFFLPSESILL